MSLTLRNSQSVSIWWRYNIMARQAGMTMGIHDGGCGGGGERGIAILASDSAPRQAGDHFEGDGGEPYVVFGYGSLIFCIRPCTFARSRLVSLYSPPHAFSLRCDLKTR